MISDHDPMESLLLNAERMVHAGRQIAWRNRDDPAAMERLIRRVARHAQRALIASLEPTGANDNAAA